MALEVRITKLKRYTAQLLADYERAAVRYAFLEPMIFDDQLHGRMFAGMRGQGFVTIREALYLDGVQSVARMVSDRGKKAPSVWRIHHTLANSPELLEALGREHGAVADLPMESIGEPVPDEIVRRIRERDRTEYIRRFDRRWSEVSGLCSNIMATEWLGKFKVARDKRTAHTEMLAVEGKGYSPMPFEDIGLTFPDLQVAMKQLEPIVDGFYLLVCNSGYAFQSLWEQLDELSGAFWAREDP